jgi:hypothetical protein
VAVADRYTTLSDDQLITTSKYIAVCNIISVDSLEWFKPMYNESGVQTHCVGPLNDFRFKIFLIDQLKGNSQDSIIILYIPANQWSVMQKIGTADFIQPGKRLLVHICINPINLLYIPINGGYSLEGNKIVFYKYNEANKRVMLTFKKSLDDYKQLILERLKRQND